MSKRVSDNELLTLVHFVKVQVAALPDIPKANAAVASVFFQAVDAHHAAARALVQDLVRDHGARLTNPLGGFRLSMAGVSATSTSGESALLTNWINAAYRELDRRRAA
ncbi:hypothetical protein [Ancylobacter sp. TS-1]|uniref:hypothetical protein n=1 Tax=Ancylobacter sp. TS-1 TaxID=1850374 RepID=UPI001265C46F|nr:hypothetical protein [Ancylobacter sp. TS-1]QFR32411.1 hypothetical protein GBB76_04365 [Ancylobacter sp. TS-1]